MTEKPDSKQPVPLSAPARFALTWLVLVACGTALLKLPSSARDQPLTWVDALFTATSAVCVTGLSTIRVDADLSGLGQTLLLVLIQIGGLGITTLSTFLLVAAGRATLSGVFQTRDTLAAVRVNPNRLVGWVVLATLCTETTGAVLLYATWPDVSWFSAGFHSISAFCNAGFSLQSNSLVSLRTNPAANAVFCALIMAGGFGFIAFYQISGWIIARLSRRRRPLPLHSKAVLVASAALWLIGALVFLIFEWGHTMTGLPASAKLLCSWFQSVTLRTAGFNTLDFGDMREPTLFLSMFLMLIGGAPGGCAGGIKVTTLLVILATVWSRTHGTESVALLGRTVPPAIVRRSFALVSLTIIFLTVVVLSLIISEEQRLFNPQRNDRFLVLAFEVVSAFGTVGLSAGVTAGLSTAGKLILCLCMFVGRLGPLAVALAVIPIPRGALYEYPKEELAIG